MTVRETILARLREVGVRVADVSVGHDDQPETWDVHYAHLNPSAFERKAVAIVLRDVAHPPKVRVSVPPIDTVPKPATLPVSIPPVDDPAPIKKHARRRPTTRPPPRTRKAKQNKRR